MMPDGYGNRDYDYSAIRGSGVDPDRRRFVELARESSETFDVFVDYQAPSMRELRQQFDSVSRWFERSAYFQFRDLDDVSREPRVVKFGYRVVVPAAASVLDARARITTTGVRPALYEELIAFARALPSEQKRFPIAAIGSVTGPKQDQRVVSVCIDPNDRRSRQIGQCDWKGEWDDFVRFLCVVTGT